MAMATLVGIPFSPWSQKARWALQHAGVEFRFKEYLPFLGQPAMRWRLRGRGGKITVPILFAGDDVLRESLAIAEFAHDQNESAALFPDRTRVVGFNRLADEACAESRFAIGKRFSADPDAQREAMHGVVPRALARPTRFVAKLVSGWVTRKYEDTVEPGATRTALETLRRSLAENGGDYVLGEFSFADMAMSVMLDMVSPPSNDYVYRAPATRECWTQPELAAEFADVIEWRDGLYERHRLPRKAN